jgi:glycerol-3-phosphate dehydrogenase (NAD(P)+)
MEGREIESVGVLGATAWGTTLAVLAALRGHRLRLWARDEEEAKRLEQAGESRRQPGLRFPPSLEITSDPHRAFADADLVVLAVPSHRLRDNLRRVRRALTLTTTVLSAVKGLEAESGLRMSEVIQEELPSLARPVCVLSGPNLSREIAQGLPAASVIACTDPEEAGRVQRALMAPSLRIYTSSDVVGVEMAGALKNVLAIGAGLADGLGYGDNAKAAFLTRGLAEITRLGVALGAQPLTFAGLAGVGDVMATCYSPYSRNRRLGLMLAHGCPLDQALADLGGVAEGVNATPVALCLARRVGVEMPITEQMHRVIFEGQDPGQGVAALMRRQAKPELSGF